MADFNYHSLDHKEHDNSGFIRKVYGILCIQLAFTAIVTGIFMYIDGYPEWISENMWLLWVTLAIQIIILSMLICFRRFSRRVPSNYILLGIFTLSEGILVGTFAALIDHTVILIAAIMTLGVTLTLTAYAFYTKKDYSACNGFMFMILVGSLIYGVFLGVFWGSRAWEITYCLAFIFIYSGYIVIDTQNLIGGGKYGLSLDDYVVGSLYLYLDIMGLFLYLARLLNRFKS